jgi:hypothetical protein
MLHITYWHFIVVFFWFFFLYIHVFFNPGEFERANLNGIVLSLCLSLDIYITAYVSSSMQLTSWEVEHLRLFFNHFQKFRFLNIKLHRCFSSCIVQKESVMQICFNIWVPVTHYPYFNCNILSQKSNQWNVLI